MTEIYGITGMPLAGKTLVAEVLEKKGFSVLDMGDVVRIEMEKQDVSVEKTGQFVNQLREKHGMDAIARLSAPYLEEIIAEKDKVVITGMRGWDEKQRFEEETGEKMDVIAVWTPRDERKDRRKERQREEDVKGDNFQERDIREINNGVGKLMALSDHMIKNNDIPKQELEEKVKQIVS